MKKLFSLTLAAAILIAAVILPACGGLCCTSSSDATMHAEMPCCEPGPPSVTPPDAGRLQPATFSGLTHKAAPLLLAASEPSSHDSFIRPPAPARDERSRSVPPLFLRNAQLLI